MYSVSKKFFMGNIVKQLVPQVHAREGWLCDQGWSPFIHTLYNYIKYIIMYVYMYVYNVCDPPFPQKFQCHFSGRLTFSKTRGRLHIKVID